MNTMNLLLYNNNTVFTEIFIVVLISDVTFITKFKKLNQLSMLGLLGSSEIKTT